jgi:hypothetical protein
LATAWSARSHGSIFYGNDQLGEADLERADDAPDGRPPRVCLAALDLRE